MTQKATDKLRSQREREIKMKSQGLSELIRHLEFLNSVKFPNKV